MVRAWAVAWVGSLVLSTVGAGCAAERLQRMAVGRPGATAPVARQLVGQAEADESHVIACFDELAGRLGTTTREEVQLVMVLTRDGATLTRVKPERPSSVVDADLVACLRQRVDVWRVAGTGEASLPLAVRTRMPSSPIQAEAAAAHAVFKPAE